MDEFTPVNAPEADEADRYTAEDSHSWQRARVLLARHIRKAHISQTAVAQAIGLSPPWVSLFLKGERDLTEVDALVRLAALLGTSIEELLPPTLRALLARRTAGDRSQVAAGRADIHAASAFEPDAQDRLEQLALDLLEILGGSEANVRRETR